MVNIITHPCTMFRHTTKQNVRSQERLRKNAAATLEKDRQILCDSVYENTYSIPLPVASRRMLDNIVAPLTGCNSEVQGDTRLMYTLAPFDYGNESKVRMCIIQPEVSSFTATTKSSYASPLNTARSKVIARLSNPSPGRISVSKGKCQVAGRIGPYIVEKSGLDSAVEWSYSNVSKSKIFYVITSPFRVTFRSRANVHDQGDDIYIPELLCQRMHHGICF